MAAAVVVLNPSGLEPMTPARQINAPTTKSQCPFASAAAACTHSTYVVSQATVKHIRDLEVTNQEPSAKPTDIYQFKQKPLRQFVNAIIRTDNDTGFRLRAAMDQ